MAKYDWQIPTKKKKHKGLIIFLIIFGILVVLPVGFVFGAFYTTETKQVSDKEVHYENIVSESLYKGLAGLGKKHPQIDFTINEEMFDGIMMAACDKINQKQFIPKMYCYINDNDYTFTIDLQASFFKTRVLLYTSLNSSGEGFEKTLTFKIKGITVGRLPIPINWITGIMSNFINDNMLNNAFEQSGFHIKSDLAHAQLTYDRLTFREDVYNYLMKMGKENPYLDILLSMFGNDKVLDVNYKNGVTASFKLEELNIPELVTPLNFVGLDKHRDKIIEWINKGEDYLKEGDVNNLFSYLVRGYNLSDKDTVQAYIDTIDAGAPIKDGLVQYVSSIVPPSSYSNDESVLTAYKGSLTSDSKSLNPIHFEQYCAKEGDKEIKADFDPDDLPNSTTFSISTESLNKYLMRSMDKAIGTTVPLTYTDENNKWSFAYTVVDNVFVEFKQETSESEPTMSMYLTINIEGVRVSIELVTDGIHLNHEEGTEDFGSLDFNLKKARFGLIPIEDLSLLDSVLNMIPKSENIFTYLDNEGKKSFSINLDKILENISAEIKTAVITLLNNSALDSKSKLVNGDFAIDFSLKS